MQAHNLAQLQQYIHTSPVLLIAHLSSNIHEHHYWIRVYCFTEMATYSLAVGLCVIVDTLSLLSDCLKNQLKQGIIILTIGSKTTWNNIASTIREARLGPYNNFLTIMTNLTHFEILDFWVILQFLKEGQYTAVVTIAVFSFCIIAIKSQKIASIYSHMIHYYCVLVTLNLLQNWPKFLEVEQDLTHQHKDILLNSKWANILYIFPNLPLFGSLPPYISICLLWA